MMIFIKATFLLVFSLISALAVAHDGHLTAGTIFHLAEHVGVVMVVLVTLSVVVIYCKRKKRVSLK